MCEATAPIGTSVFVAVFVCIVLLCSHLGLLHCLYFLVFLFIFVAYVVDFSIYFYILCALFCS